MEQRVADNDAGLIVGRVGKTRPGNRVADRVDATGARPHPPIDLDAVAAITHAGTVEIEIRGARLAAGSDQQMRAFDPALTAVLLDDQRDPGTVRLGPLYSGSLFGSHPLPPA